MNTGTRGRKQDKGNNAFLCFSERGYQLAERICAATGGDISRTGAQLTLDAWTRDAFASYDALIYIGASGIAVRAVAPYLKDKTTDPAVLVIDETGRFVIPLVSGHLGGANALAKRIADVTGAEAVITTATDRHGVFAVDEWARVQGFFVANPERIKAVSAKLLNGESVTVYSGIPVDGQTPAGVCLTDKRTADVSVGFMEDMSGLRLVPRMLVLGCGCKKGISADTLQKRFRLLCEETGIDREAVARLATIDIKEEEPGIRAFRDRNGWEISAYSAEALAAVNGDFSASAFVEDTVGVDNVCERSAVLASGGELVIGKFAGEGVTFALAKMPVRADWRLADG